MKVRWTETARDHLRAIHNYIAQDSIQNAHRFVDRIIHKAETVANSPELGSIVPEHNSPMSREVFAKSYRIIYRIYEDRIDIVAVIHGARKLPLDL